MSRAERVEGMFLMCFQCGHKDWRTVVPVDEYDTALSCLSRLVEAANKVLHESCAPQPRRNDNETELSMALSQARELIEKQP